MLSHFLALINTVLEWGYIKIINQVKRTTYLGRQIYWIIIGQWLKEINFLSPKML